MSEHRLIYADELYDTLADKLTWLMKYDCDVYLEVGKDIREAINDQPTAYDIDKVVEEIKHQIQLEFDWLRAVKHEEGHINLSDLDIAERAMKSKAVEIVKGGVK